MNEDEPLHLLRQLAEGDPKTIIGAAQMMDPEAVQFAMRLNQQMTEHLAAGHSASSLYILLAAALGYLSCGAVDTTKKHAGTAIENMTEVLVKVLRFSSEAGFAETRKEQQGGAASD